MLRVVTHAQSAEDSVARLAAEALKIRGEVPTELNLLVLEEAGAEQLAPRLPASISRVRNTTSRRIEITSFAVVPPAFCIASEQFAVMHRAVPAERGSPLIVESEVALVALTNAFDMLWLTAKSSSKADRPPQHLAGVLDQLASGVTDLTAQRALNVSSRTFNRRSAEVMRILNARSRFQAGAEAARRDWI